MTVPHFLQVLSSMFPQNFSITGGSCFTISFTKIVSSCNLLPQFSQNHKKASFSSSSSSAGHGFPTTADTGDEDTGDIMGQVTTMLFRF